MPDKLPDTPVVHLPWSHYQTIMAQLALLDAQAAEIARLTAALEPFAKVAASEVVADALSFRGRSLMLTLGFGVVAINASAFSDARAALAPAPAAEVAG